MLIKGMAISPGIAIAKCLIVHDDALTGSNRTISENETPYEIIRVHRALDEAVSRLERIRTNALVKNNSEGAEIMEAHVMMLRDPTLIASIQEKIVKQNHDAVSAVNLCVEEQASILDALDDAYLRERAQDVRDVGMRIVRILSGINERDLAVLDEDVILVSRNITPSMMAAIDKEHVKGIVSETGGKTSHTAILARSMDIPAVFGISAIEDKVADGTLISINGADGTITTEIPSDKELELRAKIQKSERTRAALKDVISAPSLTRDGIAVEISANIMDPADTKKVLDNGADGIGLYRTEFLFMDRNSAPSEEEQFLAYRKVLSAMGCRPVIIRTMDIGGDKEVPYLNLPKEENPFIGYRAIRICLDNKPLFKTQLRAILRASAHGNAMVMFPMISSVDEFRAAKALIEECKHELDAEGRAYNNEIKTGVMIEIPSAAVTADLLINEADFMSIGTNDLTQYSLAADRMNERLSDLYTPYHPGLLRLIKMVTDAAHHAGFPKFSGMCGEMAGDPFAAILLLGLGLHEFSMNPSSVTRIRKIISLVTTAEAKTVADIALTMATSKEVEAYMREVTLQYADKWIE